MSTEVTHYNASSALYWLPRLTSIDIKTGQKYLNLQCPRTQFVGYDHQQAVALLEGDRYTGWQVVLEQVAQAAQEIGYPVFIRTDLASAKHHGPRVYRADSKKDLERVLGNTVEDNEIKFWLAGPTPQAFMVREFLDLESPFTAFGGLPIAKEFRFFADKSGIVCAHAYWPALALEGHVDPEVEDWQERLDLLHQEPSPAEWQSLTAAARQAALLCPAAPAWSVDFARDKAGKWYLIDMAVMSESWHWPGCPSGGGGEESLDPKA